MDAALGAADRVLIDALERLVRLRLPTTPGAATGATSRLRAPARRERRRAGHLHARVKLFDDLARAPAPAGVTAPTTRARTRLLSSLRQFYRDLRATACWRSTSLVDAPKPPRSLPKALGEGDIERLLAAPDDSPLACATAACWN